MGSTQFIIFLDRGTFWVLPLTYFYLPRSARAYLFPQSDKQIITFAAAPLASTPFVRNQRPTPPTYIYLYLSLSLYIYIYIYMCVHLSLSLSLYIYIYSIILTKECPGHPFVCNQSVPRTGGHSRGVCTYICPCILGKLIFNGSPVLEVFNGLTRAWYLR